MYIFNVLFAATKLSTLGLVAPFSRISLTIATDDSGTVYVDGDLVCTIKESLIPVNFTISTSNRVIAVEVVNGGHIPTVINYVGFLIDSAKFFTDNSWKCTLEPLFTEEWIHLSFNDSSWPNAVCFVTSSLIKFYGYRHTNLSPKTCFISAYDLGAPSYIRLYCRKKIQLTL